MIVLVRVAALAVLLNLLALTGNVSSVFCMSSEGGALDGFDYTLAEKNLQKGFLQKH